jgi:hypothetical protein
MNTPYSFYYMELHAAEKMERAQEDAAEYRLVKEIRASESGGRETNPVGLNWVYRFAFLFSVVLVVGALTLSVSPAS